MLKLIVCSLLTIFIFLNNNQVGCFSHCFDKIFVHNTAEDDILFESGLLVEVVVSHRAECVSLSHLHEGCNLILYNPSSYLCRLHHFDHDNQTGTGISSIGWNNYAHQCEEPPTEPDCNVTEAIGLDSCQSCFYDNAWKYNDMCIAYKTSFNNTGGASIVMDLNFDLQAGMAVVVKGPVFDIGIAVSVCLEDTDDPASHLGLYLTAESNMCEAYNESSTDFCSDVMPLVDVSEVTITYILTNRDIQIFIDGTFVIQYLNLLRRNRMNISGFGDVVEINIIRTAASCNQP